MDRAKTTPSPKPEVLYLPAIFRAIRAGEIRIPAFQRGFVWKPAQVLELLESVYQGFPIGSVLLWRVNIAMMQSDTSEDIPFPHPPREGEVDFVLDGMQRISSLYGAFNAGDGESLADPFAVAFDLLTEEFRPQREITDTCIDLRRLFNPRHLLEDQGRLAKLDGGDALVERTLEIQRVFQEYLVPIVRISNASPEQVVQIFERVNNTGTRLSAVDFMRALTWSDKFDLTAQLDKIADSIVDLGGEIPNDTLAKIIALSMDIAPTGEEMVGLRKKSPQELLRATKRTTSSLREAWAYFQGSLRIFSYDFVPYEGQLLVAASIAAGGAFPTWYPEWFWTVGFSESLQGRPDHSIARLALDARQATPSGLPERFSVSKEALKTKAIRKGAALGTTFLAAIATTPPYSVFTGKALDASALTSEFERAMLGAIFERAALAAALDRPPPTDKVICNVVLLGPDERVPQKSPESVRQAIVNLADRKGGLRKLASQLIDEKCVRAIKKGDVGAFLDARADLVFKRAAQLSGVPLKQ